MQPQDDIFRTESWMTVEPLTIRSEQTVGEALVLMFERDIRHLPVLKEGRLVGIVSDRDIRQLLGRASVNSEDRTGEDRYLQLAVHEVMSLNPMTVRARTPIREVIKTMADRKFGAVPVVDPDENVIGIFTETDALRYCLYLIDRVQDSRLSV